MQDKIPGGLAKGKSLQDIAKYHKLPTQRLLNALTKGVKVEKEHTTDESIAKEIAMDHLWEDPKYYEKLETIEEGKNIGPLYHFTSLNNLELILDSNILKTTEKYDYWNSFTRDKNLWKKSVLIGGYPEVRIVVDGTKLSETYKIKPFNYWKGEDKKRADYTEAEERIKGDIKDFDKYVISYDVGLVKLLLRSADLDSSYFKRIFKILKDLEKNSKVHFYFENHPVDLDKFYFDKKYQVAAESKIKEKADKYGLDAYALELAKGLEETLSEGKNIGLLYHFTDSFSTQLILKQNTIKGSGLGIRPRTQEISLTRDKNLWKKNLMIKGDSIRLVLDGTKLSENYKIEPFNDEFISIKANSGQEIIKKYTKRKEKADTFEAEERILGPIEHIDKYLISIDIVKPLNISNSDREFFENYKEKPVKWFLEGKLISDPYEYLKKKYKIAESKEKIEEYHNQQTLNPNLWDGEQLKPKFKEGLLKIAQYFINKVKDIELKVDDIVLTGSSVNYNWTQYSDIDLHILVDFSKYKDPNLAKKYFESLKNSWNKEFDLKIANNEIELYFQDINEPHAAMGVYSLLNDKWLKKSTKEDIEVSDEEIQKKAQLFKDKIDNFESLPKEEALSQIEKLKEKIRRFRQCGLEKGGEYSVENLAFKELRNSGYLEKINQIKKDDEQRELSSFINEGKNIGILYHFTTVKNAIKIVEQNIINASNSGRRIYISFTRDKNLYKQNPDIAGTEVRLVLDGNKISDNYKLKPYDYLGGFSRKIASSNKGEDNRNLANKSYKFEAEEFLDGKDLKNLDKYLISIDIIDPDNITNIEGVEFFENYDKFPVRFFDKTGKLISDYGKNNFKQQVAESQYPNTHKDLKQNIKLLTQYMLDKGLKIQPLPKVKFVYSDLVNAKDSLGRTAHYDFDRMYITLYTRYRHPKDILRSYAHEMIHHEQKLTDKIKDISTTNINKDNDLKELEREAYEKGNMIFREWENSLEEEKLTEEYTPDYPSEFFDKKYGTKLSHSWKGHELLNAPEIRNWQKIKHGPLTQEQLDKVDNLFNIIVEKNPELKQLPANDYQQKIDILHGVESKYNVDDIEYFLSDEHQKIDDDKRIERYHKITSTPGIKDSWDVQWVMSPKTHEYVKQHLNEVDDESTKYWALFANIYDALKKDPDNVYNKLKPKLSGEQLKALDYFYPMAKDPSLLREGKNIGPLYHFTNIEKLDQIINKNELKPRYSTTVNYDRKRIKDLGKITTYKSDGLYISFTRDKNFHKQIRTVSGIGCRIVLDGTKLSDNYKINPYNDKNFSFKRGMKLPSGGNRYNSYEAEERINDIVKPLDKYVLSYDIFVDKAEHEYVKDDEGDKYNRFIEFLVDLSKNPKVKFYLDNKEVPWEKIEDYYQLNKKQVAAEQRLFNLAVRKDPEALTWLGQQILKEVLEDNKKKIEIYPIKNAEEQLGLPKYIKWAISINGNFEEGFKTRQEAENYKKNLEKKNLNEAKQRGTLYHFTGLHKLSFILGSNSLKSSDYKTRGSRDSKGYIGEVYSISLTRNKNPNKKFHGIEKEVRINIDGDKLSEKYKIEPFNYSQTATKHSGGWAEEEERITSDKQFEIKDLDKYVISYDIIIENNYLGKVIETFNELYPSSVIISRNPKVRYIRDGEIVTKEEIIDGVNKYKKQVAESRKSKLFDMALRKDPDKITELGQDIIKYDAWVVPDDSTLKREFHVEQELRGHKFFNSLEEFLQACKDGQIEEITKEKDQQIDYRVQTKDKNELLSMIKTFKSYPEYRNEKTLDGLYKNIKENKPLDLPIVLEFENGSRRLLSGNTRMNVAFQLGVNPKVLIIKVPPRIKENIDKQELDSVEFQADQQLPINVKFSDHFFDRVNDPRNTEEIYVEDLFDFFNHLSVQKDKFVSFLKKYKEIIATDHQSQINIPFILTANKIIAKTIMRKKNFMSSDPKLVFESKNVGILYHNTNFQNLQKILKSNRLNSTNYTRELPKFKNSNSENWSDYKSADVISFTRDKKFSKLNRSVATGVRIVVDGTKLSENYKIEPFNDKLYSKKHQKYNPFEAEEMLSFKSNQKDKFVKDFDKYVISYDVELDKIPFLYYIKLDLLDLKENPKVNFYYKGKPVDLDKILDDKASRYYINKDGKTVAAESKLQERKQVGEVYHFTSPSNFLQILADNKLKTGDIIYGFGGDENPFISVTRDKNFIHSRLKRKESYSISGGEIGIILDGDVISDQYKLKPYDYNSEEEGVGDEAEERIQGKKIKLDRGIKNIKKYIKGIIFTKVFYGNYKNGNDIIVPLTFENYLESSVGTYEKNIDGDTQIEFKNPKEKEEFIKLIIEKELPGTKMEIQK